MAWIDALSFKSESASRLVGFYMCILHQGAVHSFNTLSMEAPDHTGCYGHPCDGCGLVEK